MVSKLHQAIAYSAFKLQHPSNGAYAFPAVEGVGLAPVPTMPCQTINQLDYLARRTGRFGATTLMERYEIENWANFASDYFSARAGPAPTAPASASASTARIVNIRFTLYPPPQCCHIRRATRSAPSAALPAA